MKASRRFAFALLILCLLAAGMLASCKGIIAPKEPVINEEQARGFLNTANEYMNAKPPQPARANDFFKSAIDSNYKLLPAHLGYQDSFFAYYSPDAPAQAKQKDAMLAMYEKFVKRYPADPMFQFLYGRMLDKLGKRREAVPYFKEAVRLDKTYYPAHAALAKFYEEVDKSMGLAGDERVTAEKYRTIQELRSAIAADPANIALHREYQDAMLAAESGKAKYIEPGTVMKEYEQRLQQARGTADEPRYLYLHGRLLGQMRSLEDARTEFEHAANLNPKFPWSYDGLGTYYILKAQEPGTSQKDADDYVNKAMQMYEKAVRLDNKLVTTKLKLAELYLNVSALRQGEAGEILARAAGQALTPEEQDKIKSLRDEAYHLGGECKARISELLADQPQNPEVLLLTATFQYADGSYFLAKQTAAAGLALIKEKPPIDPETGEKMEAKLTGIMRDSDIFAKRLAGNGADEVPPQFFFEPEFRARMQSDDANLRANMIETLVKFYVRVLQIRDSLNEKMLADYEQMQKTAVVLMGEALSDKADNVRLAAVQAVRALQVEPFCEEIGKILIDANEPEEMRHEAALALGEMRSAKAVEPLIEGLKDESQPVREYSIKALRDLAVQTFGYDYAAAPEKRNAAIEKIKKWWEENKAAYQVPK